MLRQHQWAPLATQLTPQNTSWPSLPIQTLPLEPFGKQLKKCRFNLDLKKCLWPSPVPLWGGLWPQELQSGTDRTTVNKDVYGPICRPETGQDVRELWEYAVIQAHRDNFPPLSVMHFPENPVLRPNSKYPMLEWRSWSVLAFQSQFRRGERGKKTPELMEREKPRALQGRWNILMLLRGFLNAYIIK